MRAPARRAGLRARGRSRRVARPGKRPQHFPTPTPGAPLYPAPPPPLPSGVRAGPAPRLGTRVLCEGLGVPPADTDSSWVEESKERGFGVTQGLGTPAESSGSSEELRRALLLSPVKRNASASSGWAPARKHFGKCPRRPPGEQAPCPPRPPRVGFTRPRRRLARIRVLFPELGCPRRRLALSARPQRQRSWRP